MAFTTRTKFKSREPEEVKRNRLQGEITVLENRISETKKDKETILDLKPKLKKLEQEIKDKEKRLSELNDILSEKNNQVVAFEINLEEHKSRHVAYVDLVEKEKLSIGEELKVLKDQKFGYENQIGRLLDVIKTTKAAQEKELNAHNNKLEDSRKENGEFLRQKDKLKLSIETLKEQEGLKKANVAMLEREIKQLLAKQNGIQLEIATAVEKIAKDKVDIKDRIQKLEEKSVADAKEAEERMTEVEKAEKAIEKKEENLKWREDTLERKASNLRKKLAAIEAKYGKKFDIII